MKLLAHRPQFPPAGLFRLVDPLLGLFLALHNLGNNISAAAKWAFGAQLPVQSRQS